MRYHGNRDTYFIVGQGLVELPAPDIIHEPVPVVEAADAPGQEVKYKFGWMFERSHHAYTHTEQETVKRKLVGLGNCMNDPKNCHAEPDGKDSDDSSIPAGYTYLGQFLAHEITFDSLAPVPAAPAETDNYRSPEIDLDSLYGAGPQYNCELYADNVHLKIGSTSKINNLNRVFQNDLPRDNGNVNNPKQALIGDPRNDENLAVAQTHVAFIKFHNKVVDRLKEQGCAEENLFEHARGEVVKHFQWIIVEDYLPRLVGADVMNCVRRHGLKKFKIERPEDLFMPLEFAVAAFRIGHSMVRNRYEWNSHHNSEWPIEVPAKLVDLFEHTNFSGNLGGKLRLAADWVIDWRHFYDFKGFDEYTAVPLNMARKLDTLFSLRLDKIKGYPHHSLDREERAITVRNLLRGFALGVPTGEEVAQWLGETPLSVEELASGPQSHVLSDPVFQGRTPLWYYILKESEVRKGGLLLGPVGGRIVAGTLLEIIRHSRHSILDGSSWRPKFGRAAQGAEPARFEMVDLLHFADVVDPIGNRKSI